MTGDGKTDTNGRQPGGAACLAEAVGDPTLLPRLAVLRLDFCWCRRLDELGAGSGGVGHGAASLVRAACARRLAACAIVLNAPTILPRREVAPLLLAPPIAVRRLYVGAAHRVVEIDPYAVRTAPRLVALALDLRNAVVCAPGSTPASGGHAQAVVSKGRWQFDTEANRYPLHAWKTAWTRTPGGAPPRTSPAPTRDAPAGGSAVAERHLPGSTAVLCGQQAPIARGSHRGRVRRSRMHGGRCRSCCLSRPGRCGGPPAVSAPGRRRAERGRRSSVSRGAPACEAAHRRQPRPDARLAAALDSGSG